MQILFIRTWQHFPENVDGFRFEDSCVGDQGIDFAIPGNIQKFLLNMLKCQDSSDILSPGKVPRIEFQ